MVKPVTHRDLMWGYVAQGLNLTSGLLLLPAIVHYLSPADVGLWFVFMALASLAQLLELGFQPTLTRNIAYVYGGAHKLTKDSLPSNDYKHDEINVELLAIILDAARTIYKIVAVLATLILLTVGSLYIYSLVIHDVHTGHPLFAWSFFSLGYTINFYFGYLNGFLQGKGDVAQSSQVTAYSRMSLLLFGMIALVSGFGLMGLGLASLASAGVSRLIANYFFSRDATVCKIKQWKVVKTDRHEMMHILWHNAGRLGIVQLGAFLIQRGNVLIAASFLGLVASGSYGMTVTILIALSGIAGVICQMQVPHLSVLQAQKNRAGAARIYGEILLVSWSIYFVGLLFVMFAMKDLLKWIGAHSTILPMTQLMALGAIMFLEMNHSVAATYLTTLNKIPFRNAAIISGVSILLLSLVLVKPFGLTGLIVAQGGVQLVYNNWKWPMESMRHLRYSFLSIVIFGAKNFAQRFK